MKKMNKPAWHGGNKIPDSYLKRFCKAVEDEDIPAELRRFMENLK